MTDTSSTVSTAHPDAAQQFTRLDAARADAHDWKACPLWELGTQTVFDAGQADARLIFSGQWFTSVVAQHVFATVHPSYILIQPAETSNQWLETLPNDLIEDRSKLEELD